jgi:hypothetical protein
MLLKRAESAFWKAMAMRSNKFARKFPVWGTWICGLTLRSPKPALKPMMEDITATIKTLYPKRTLRRPNAKPAEIGSTRPKKTSPSRTVTAITGSRNLRATQKVRLEPRGSIS